MEAIFQRFHVRFPGSIPLLYIVAVDRPNKEDENGAAPISRSIIVTGVLIVVVAAS